VPPLEEIRHHDADLSPLAAEHLLKFPGVNRVRPLGPGVVLHLTNAIEHQRPPCCKPSTLMQARVRRTPPPDRRCSICGFPPWWPSLAIVEVRRIIGSSREKSCSFIVEHGLPEDLVHLVVVVKRLSLICEPAFAE